MSAARKGSRGEAEPPPAEEALISMQNLARDARRAQDFLTEMRVRKNCLIAATDPYEFKSDTKAEIERERWRVFLREWPSGLWVEFTSITPLIIYDARGLPLEGSTFVFRADGGAPTGNRTITISASTTRYRTTINFETTAVYIPLDAL